MQSLDEPWTEEEGDGPDHPYYNSVPTKMPPPGGFLDARLKGRPHAPEAAQVSWGVLFLGGGWPSFAFTFFSVISG